ncbi:MAG: hypothetical protein M3R38_11115 [Actinomycetota bacterium]|nr:hypothetical protein [Actinomycetota bacterium]
MIRKLAEILLVTPAAPVPNVPTWLQYASPVVSLLALGLAVLSLYLQRRDKHPRLKIRHKTAMVPSLPSPDDPRAQFHVANPGEQTITVSAVHLVLKGGRRIPVTGGWMIDTEGKLGFITLPCKLTSGESVSFLTDLRQLAKVLESMGYYPKAKFKIEVTDATDKTYTKRTKINTKEWGE